MKKSIIAFNTFLFLCSFSLTASEASMSAFKNGCKAFSEGDWTSAIFSLRKAASYEENANPETYYMLINAEIYSEDFKNALDTCEYYLETFRNSMYESNVMYLKGRCLYALGEYDKSVIVLSDFCHQNEGHDMYASALFWIGECFYACYQYDDAAALYHRVVRDFPGDSKTPAAQYRIETINQRDREEKLLYLLKQTGEEYLFAKEEYERQMKIYTPENTAAQRLKLDEIQEKYKELEAKYEELERELALAKMNENKIPENIAEGDAELQELVSEKNEELPVVEINQEDEPAKEIENIEPEKEDNAVEEEKPLEVTKPESDGKKEEEENSVKKLKRKAAQTKLLLDLFGDD